MFKKISKLRRVTMMVMMIIIMHSSILDNCAMSHEGRNHSLHKKHSDNLDIEIVMMMMMYHVAAAVAAVVLPAVSTCFSYYSLPVSDVHR